MRGVPRLHLPSLSETLKRYLDYVEPIARSREEFERTRELCAKFERDRGVQLHRELERRRDAIGDEGSYVSPFWDDMYLSGLYPVVVHSNPSVSLKPDPLHTTQSRRAAALILGLCKWWCLMRNDMLPPDTIPSRKSGVPDTPLCVASYSRLLGTVRKALPQRDRLHFYPDAYTPPFGRTSHVRLDVIDDMGRIMNFDTLENTCVCSWIRRRSATSETH